ncbi:MAG: hypothetical protein KBS94_08700 [Prevotella sp.]|nr:hypothetical protein [Candidatus Equicola faecalis]
MKKLLLIVVLSIIGLTTTFAQEAEKKSASKTVEFLSKDGSFFKKEFYDLPAVGSSYNKFDCQVLIITDLKSNEKRGCLRLTAYYFSSVSKDSYIGTLDPDELDACIMCFEKIVSEITASPASIYTEVEYKTRDGVRLGTYWNDKKSEWKTYVQTKSYSSRSMSFVSNDNVASLISNLKQAKQMIAEKTAK